MDVSVPQVAEELGAVQPGHLHDQSADVEPFHLGAVLALPLLLQALLVRLADLALRGEALLGHPGAEHLLDEAEELLDVRFHLVGARHVRIEVRVRADLEEQVLAEVDRLVAPPAAKEGGFLRCGRRPVADDVVGAFLAAALVRFDHRVRCIVRSLRSRDLWSKALLLVEL